MGSRNRVVVIGNGMAGARLAEHLVRAHRPVEVVMFGDEPYGNYNRILLSSVLAGSHRSEDIVMNPLSWYAANGVTLHSGVRATAIDREARSVTGSNGVVEEYDHLVFATGSHPFVPPIDGLRDPDGVALKAGAHVFRTLDDALAILDAAPRARSAVVIGGGLLGLEAARGLLGRGLDIHVVEMSPFPMAVQLDSSAGDVLKRTLEGMGIALHTGTSVAKVRGGEHVEGVVLGDGTEVRTDLVVVSAGIRPNVQLARDAGLEVRRGIVVGDDLSSVSDARVHAIGECAEHRGTVYGLVAPGWAQAEVLGSRLGSASPDRTYDGSSTSTRLKVMGVDLLVLGEKEASLPTDEVVTFSNPMAGVYKKIIVRDGVLVGGILLGDPMGGPRLLEAFHRRSDLPADRADLLFPPPMTATISETVADAPDSLQVCNCNGVSKGQILEAIRSGSATVSAVCETTRAGTGCGSCRSQLKDLLEAVRGGPVPEDPSMHFYVPAVPLTKPELVDRIRRDGLKSVSAVLGTLSAGAADAKSKAGLASLLKILWGGECEDERDARFINDRVHANIQKDGTFSVVPRILGGVVTPDQLRAIADVAEKYAVPMVKITGGQRIDLLGVQRSQLPGMWRDLGMASGHAYTKAVRTVKTCVGEEFCRFGLGNSTRLGIEMETRFQGIETPHKVKMSVSACPRNCAEATTKDLGVVAIEGGRWEIYVGGAAGATVRRGDLLSVVDTHDDVLRYTGRFLQYYRENAKYLERTYGFVTRVGIVELRRLLVDDDEGLGDRLDHEIETAVEAYEDPWAEGHSPVHPLQFSRELETSRVASGAAAGAGASSGRAPNR